MASHSINSKNSRKLSKASLAELGQAVQVKLWEANPRRYSEDCLEILPKVGERKRLVLNAHQIEVQDEVDRQRAQRKPVRIQILKERQTGVSTIGSANLFHSVRFSKGVGMVVSMDLDSSEHIFGIIQRFYHYLPATEQKVLKSVASNRKELKFDEPHGGRIVVETAGKTTAGHSFTIRYLLLSEVSRWPEGCEDARAGLLNAVPRDPDTMIIIESVANGMSGWFWEEWNRKDSDYAKIFLAWFKHEEYQKELPLTASEYANQLDPEEIELRDLYSLSLEQIEWRRWAIRNNCHGNKDKFKEQYPSNAREAFIASGNTFFHIPTLEKIRVIDPLRCDLRTEKNIAKREEIRPIVNERGLHYLWKRAQKGVEYVIGCDVAEGIEIDGAPADDRHDYSSADVIDRYTGEQVLQLHGKITPAEYGELLYLVGKYYNWAYIGVEANAGYGGHVLDTLVRLGYPADRIYRRQVLDEATRKSTNKLGWYTTKANRRSMMSALDMAIRANEILLNSEEAVKELMAFITKPDGKIEAGSGQKDDRVFSLAIAYQMLATAPPMQLGRVEEYAPEAIVPQTYQPSRSIYAFRRSAYRN